MTTGLCTIDGCIDTIYAKAMCRPHYRRSRPRPTDKPTQAACVMCGTTVIRSGTGYRNKYGPRCSYECRRRVTFGWSEPLPELHWARMYGATCEWHPPRNAGKPTFIGCVCEECGYKFVTPNHGQRTAYCSLACQRRVAKRVRRAREHNAEGSFRFAEVIAVFIRQGKVCAYCTQPIAGLPDPEHVLPLSRGGRNDITNLVAACRPCNADKNDLTLDEWAEDRARRGLPSVRTQLTGVEFRHLVVRPPTRPAWRNLNVA